MSYVVYILRNSEGRYYIGQTSNLVLRLQRHNDGKVSCTKNRGPWEMAYSRGYASRSEAMAEERRLKGLKSKKALERFIAQR
jgi:putative endonuclease